MMIIIIRNRRRRRMRRRTRAKGKGGGVEEVRSQEVTKSEGFPRQGALVADLFLLNPPRPVSPVNLHAVEDEESMDGVSELSDVEDVFVGEEAELPKMIRCENRPSEEEVKAHNRTHLPYRSWRPHCVRGKAWRGNRRRRMRRLRSNIPVISVDYMWMKGKRGEGEEEPKGPKVTPS